MRTVTIIPPSCKRAAAQKNEKPAVAPAGDSIAD